MLILHCSQSLGYKILFEDWPSICNSCSICILTLLCCLNYDYETDASFIFFLLKDCISSSIKEEKSIRSLVFFLGKNFLNELFLLCFLKTLIIFVNKFTTLDVWVKFTNYTLNLANTIEMYQQVQFTTAVQLNGLIFPLPFQYKIGPLWLAAIPYLLQGRELFPMSFRMQVWKISVLRRNMQQVQLC